MDTKLFFSKLSELDIRGLAYINHNRIQGTVPFLIFVTDTAYLVSVLTPLTILAIAVVSKRLPLKRIGYQLLIALVASTIITNLLKYVVNRPRPFTTYKYIEKLSTGGSPAFPSGHTADAFVMAISVSLVVGDQPKWLVPTWLWALTVAYSRMALGVHYPTDVLMSMLIGLSCALLGKWIVRQFLTLKTL